MTEKEAIAKILYESEGMWNLGGFNVWEGTSECLRSKWKFIAEVLLRELNKGIKHDEN